MRLKIAFGLFIISTVLCGCWGLSLFTAPLQKFMNYYGMHGLGVFWLAMLLSLISLKDNPNKKFRLLGFAVFTWFTALLNEFIQLFIPFRVVDKWDVLAQSAGAIAAFLVAWWAAAGETKA